MSDVRGCTECAALTRATTARRASVTAQRPGPTRRGVLAGGALAGLLASLGSQALAPRLAFAGTETPYDGDTLVVLSLRGGFDGLSAVAPVGDPHLAALRPTIGVTGAVGLGLDSMFALHPALTGLKSLYDAGSLAVVHATGLPQPNRSHFEAMAQIEAATPGSPLRTGWLDRVLALHDPAGPFGAVQLGGGGLPYSLLGDFPALGIQSVDDFDLDGVDAESLSGWTSFLTAAYSRAPAKLAASAGTALGALATTAALEDAGYTPGHGVEYPESDLARQLRDVARLVKAGVGLRVATIDYGDWDMHSGLGRPDGGWMADHLRELDDALTAFATDLGAEHLGRVTLVTMSEFGRRAGENENAGVDHGWGNVMFVLGGNVNGGTVFGSWPGLADDALDDGDLAVTTDYRAVLADVLRNRANASAGEVSTVFPGWSGTTLGVTRAA